MGILKFFRVLSLAATLVLAASIQAQGGQGGMQGNIGGPEEDSYPPRILDSGDEGRRWLATSAILTQGDKVEYKIKGVPGQTIFATVRSDVFDPALKILDEKGKVVTENDDQYEGNQAPLIMYQFKDDKEYKLIVQNYRSSAGGRFKLYTQTFMPMEITLGGNKKTLKSPDDLPGHGGHLVYFHFKAEANKTYAVRRTFFSSPGNSWDLLYRGIIGPTGVKKTDYSVYQQEGQNGPLFEAKTKGDFYLVYDSPSKDGNVSARLDDIEVGNLDKTSSTKFDLGPTGQRIFKTKVEKSDIVRTTISAPESVVFQYNPRVALEGEKQVTRQGSFELYHPLLTNDQDAYRLYMDKGDVIVIVSSESDKPTQVTMTNRMDVPVWPADTEVTGKVDLGETQFYFISGTKGDIQRIKGKATGFELEFSLVAMDGTTTQYVNQKRHLPTAELQYLENRKYLVMVSSPQGGGSGAYSMTLEAAKPEPLALGKAVDYHDGAALGTYSLDIQANTWYQLTTRGNGSYLLLDDHGDVIGVFRVQFGSQVAYYFLPSHSGKIRFKVRDGANDTRFRVDPHAIPNLGG
jgi:hypothetical protein